MYLAVESSLFSINSISAFFPKKAYQNCLMSNQKTSPSFTVAIALVILGTFLKISGRFQYVIVFFFKFLLRLQIEVPKTFPWIVDDNL